MLKPVDCLPAVERPEPRGKPWSQPCEHGRGLQRSRAPSALPAGRSRCWPSSSSQRSLSLSTSCSALPYATLQMPPPSFR